MVIGTLESCKSSTLLGSCCSSPFDESCPWFGGTFGAFGTFSAFTSKGGNSSSISVSILTFIPQQHFKIHNFNSKIRYCSEVVVFCSCLHIWRSSELCFPPIGSSRCQGGTEYYGAGSAH